MIDLLANNSVLVTGAASGIGRAVAEKYCNYGYNVVGLDLNIDHQSPFTIIECDISDSNSIEQACDALKDRINSVKYLINCAGKFFINYRFFIEEMDLHEWESVIRTNLTGTMKIVKYMLPLIKNTEGDRAIINITSDQAFYPRKRNAAYAVSKGGLECFTKACAVELLQYGIRVNAVAPATVKTNFINMLSSDKKKIEEIYRNQDEMMPFGIIEAEDIANLVYYLGSDLAAKITGQTILVDSGLYLK